GRCAGRARKGRPGRIRTHPRTDRSALAPRVPRSHAVLQDRRRLPRLAQWPPGTLRHDRRPAERPRPHASRGAVRARRRGRASARPRARLPPHAEPSGRARLQRLELLAMDSPRQELLSINTATLRKQWALPDIISGCARRGIRFVSPWRDQVAQAGLKETARRLRDSGVALSGYCRGGMFPAVDRQARKLALDDNRRAVDEALALGAPCLVLVVGGLPRSREGTVESKDLAGAREMVRDGIGELLDYARPAGMPLAIEPLHPMYAADRACVNTMAHANHLCDELAPGGNSGLGIAVDVYHVWWDPELRREIERAGGHAGRLMAYHLSDWLVPTTD